MSEVDAGLEVQIERLDRVAVGLLDDIAYWKARSGEQERMVRELQGNLGELTRENARLKSCLRDLVVLVEWLGNTGSRGAKDALSEVQA